MTLLGRRKVQPTQAEWDAWDAEWWATDDSAPTLANDGRWIVSRRCLDCRVAYYADDEHDPTKVHNPCPACGGERWHCTSEPMSWRAELCEKYGTGLLPFGSIQLDHPETG